MKGQLLLLELDSIKWVCQSNVEISFFFFSDINFEFVPCDVNENPEMIDESAYDSTVKIKIESDCTLSDKDKDCSVKEEYSDSPVNFSTLKNEEGCCDIKKVNCKKDDNFRGIVNIELPINIQETVISVCNNVNYYNYNFEMPKIFQCQRCKSKIVGNEDIYMTHVFYCGR